MYTGPYVSGKKAKQLVEKGALLIDVRDPVSFRDGAIPGAVNMSLRQISSLQKHPRTTTIVLYGSPSDLATVNAAVNYIMTYGFTKVHVLRSKEEWV